MNLDDGGALTAFRLRRADGAPVGRRQLARRRAAALHVFGADEVRFTPLRTWPSPATGARYPVQWRIDTPAGASKCAHCSTRRNSTAARSTGTVYWEGLSELFDAQGNGASASATWR